MLIQRFYREKTSILGFWIPLMFISSVFVFQLQASHSFSVPNSRQSTPSPDKTSTYYALKYGQVVQNSSILCILLLQSIRWMQSGSLNETLGSCRPWEFQTENLKDNLNTLNTLKLNLCSYQKVYKKHSTKTKAELPGIKAQTTKNKAQVSNSKGLFYVSKNKTLHSTSKIHHAKNGYYNRSVELNPHRSTDRFLKVDKLNRGRTSIEIKNQNEDMETDRLNIISKNSRCDLKSKVCLIKFDEQNKYRMLKKREIHQLIFGEKEKHRKRLITQQLR